MSNGRAIALAVVVTFVVVLLLAATYVYSGVYNVSAARGHGGVVASALHTIADRSIETHAKAPAPPALDSAALIEGAEHFHEMCVTCHGAPGVSRGEIGEGLNPLAPELSKRVAGELTEAQIYWVIRNGIKFTGMPSFTQSHTDEQIWAIARFTKRLNGMNATEYEAIFRAIKAANGEMPASTHRH